MASRPSASTDPISSSSSPSYASPKRPLPPSATAQTPRLSDDGPSFSSPAITSHFAAKRPRATPQDAPLGTGLQLRCVQRAGAITDVTGDTEQCKEMLLKPLGFRWERSLKVWRWDGNGDDSRDPTNELLVRAARDGVQVTHVKFRPAVAQKSARAILASLMADVESPSPASAAAPASEDDWQISDEALASLPDVVPLAAAPPPLATAPANDDDWQLSDEVLANLPDALPIGSQAPVAIPSAPVPILGAPVTIPSAPVAILGAPVPMAAPGGATRADEDDWAVSDAMLASLPEHLSTHTSSGSSGSGGVGAGGGGDGGVAKYSHSHTGGSSASSVAGSSQAGSQIY
jgi:hypothetical protein